MLCLVAGAVVLFGSSAQAATSPSVQINFTGNYVAASCTVAGDANQLVTLPTISTQSLNAAGQTAGSTMFTIPVKCDSGVPYVRVYFESGATTAATTGNLNLTSVSGKVSAGGVQVQLQNVDGTLIKVGDRSTMKIVTVNTTDSMPISFIARYYATGASTAGVVQTYVTYVLEMP
ncbi:type 1 fimbrial protein [Trinickia terrae]|uniref:Type 1 fimbrial protein n=2 Tax=Trinickia terrae TaxID=2571161 RepID=A0A4V5PJ84_9BURK|nr:type 1 fimbrial protein [Trinickia terrae]